MTKYKMKNMYVVNNIDESSFRAPCQNGHYTNTHLEHHESCRTTRKEKKHYIDIFKGYKQVLPFCLRRNEI